MSRYMSGSPSVSRRAAKSPKPASTPPPEDREDEADQYRLNLWFEWHARHAFAISSTGRLVLCRLKGRPCVNGAQFRLLRGRNIAKAQAAAEYATSRTQSSALFADLRPPPVRTTVRLLIKRNALPPENPGTRRERQAHAEGRRALVERVRWIVANPPLCMMSWADTQPPPAPTERGRGRPPKPRSKFEQMIDARGVLYRRFIKKAETAKAASERATDARRKSSESLRNRVRAEAESRRLREFTRCQTRASAPVENTNPHATLRTREPAFFDDEILRSSELIPCQTRAAPPVESVNFHGTLKLGGAVFPCGAIGFFREPALNVW